MIVLRGAALEPWAKEGGEIDGHRFIAGVKVGLPVSLLAHEGCGVGKEGLDLPMPVVERREDPTGGLRSETERLQGGEERATGGQQTTREASPHEGEQADVGAERDGFEDSGQPLGDTLGMGEHGRVRIEMYCYLEIWNLAVAVPL
jgi:hypothetical protein